VLYYSLSALVGHSVLDWALREFGAWLDANRVSGYRERAKAFEKSMESWGYARRVQGIDAK
jgi:hypothetical protein